MNVDDWFPLFFCSKMSNYCQVKFLDNIIELCKNRCLEKKPELYISIDAFDQVPAKDLEYASKCLVKALLIREKYMAMAMQSFPKTTAKFIQNLSDKQDFNGIHDDLEHEDMQTIEGME